MIHATVGGRSFDFNKGEIELRMRGVRPEPIREHLVEVIDTVYPPKQVLATITGWDRASFTTMEAQRVLSRVGFVCRRAGTVVGGGRRAWVVDQGHDEETEILAEPGVFSGRLARLEAQLAVAQEAIASLAARVQKLELAVR
jgi:hypothetical protein